MQLLVPFSWACHLNPKICSRVGMSLDRVSGSHFEASVRASVGHRSIHAGEKQTNLPVVVVVVVVVVAGVGAGVGAGGVVVVAVVAVVAVAVAVAVGSRQ